MELEQSDPRKQFWEVVIQELWGQCYQYQEQTSLPQKFQAFLDGQVVKTADYAAGCRTSLQQNQIDLGFLAHWSWKM